MKRTVKKHFVVYFVAIFIIALLFLGARFYASQSQERIQQAKQEAAEQSQAEAESRLTKVKVAEIIPVPFTDILILPGTVVAHEDIDLAAKTSGTVEWIGVKEGKRIKKGEKLLQVDITSTKTKVAEARANYEKALKDYERQKKLFNEQIASKETLDNAKTTLETSQAALDAASVSLEDGTLFSPISGILDKRYIDPGEYINSGQTVMKIVDIDQVYIELPVPEKDILYFKKGQKVKIEMSLSGQESCEESSETKGQEDCQFFTGVIDFVSMTADSSTRTYLVKVIVKNSDHTLRPGMIVRARLVRRELQEAIAVPFFTMIDREDGKAVFVVEDGVARVRPIEYGTFQKGLVEVRNGLQIGERLIIVGQRNLVDGEKVEVTEDLTPLARQWIAEGKDLSELTLDILR